MGDLIKFACGDFVGKGKVVAVGDDGLTIGDSTGREQSEASHKAGFREAMRITRTMQDTKKAFNPAIGKIKQEQILVLENVGGL